MNERPILFSGPMIRAILEGRKTQTRRVVKPQPMPMPITNGSGDGEYSAWPNAGACIDWGDVLADVDYYVKAGFCPYGAPGDRLWVRETWATVKTLDTINAAACYQYDRPPVIYYPNETDSPNRGRWRPSIHMPRWASRIALELTGVRVERVHEISEADAQAEGMTERTRLPGVAPLYAMTFATLWDEINAKRGYDWASNPYVWVLEFRRVA